MHQEGNNEILTCCRFAGTLSQQYNKLPLTLVNQNIIMQVKVYSVIKIKSIDC